MVQVVEHLQMQDPKLKTKKKKKDLPGASASWEAEIGRIAA
jgi:hypothetical protein